MTKSPPSLKQHKAAILKASTSIGFLAPSLAWATKNAANLRLSPQWWMAFCALQGVVLFLGIWCHVPASLPPLQASFLAANTGVLGGLVGTVTWLLAGFGSAAGFAIAKAVLFVGAWMLLLLLVTLTSARFHQRMDGLLSVAHVGFFMAFSTGLLVFDVLGWAQGEETNVIWSGAHVFVVACLGYYMGGFIGSDKEEEQGHDKEEEQKEELELDEHSIPFLQARIV